MTKEDRGKFAKILVEECKSQEGATDADVDAAMNHESPNSRGLKCMHACMHEKLGIIKDGVVSIDGTLEFSKKAFGEDATDAINMAKDIATECASITDPERCELSAKHYDCVQKAMEKRGVDMNTFF